MKIRDRVPSRERCAESGWYACDFLLDGPMDEAFIRSIRGFGGSFLFLSSLRRPFFKLEAEHYVLKGCLGDAFFRMAADGEHLEELDRLQAYLAPEQDLCSEVQQDLCSDGPCG